MSNRDLLSVDHLLLGNGWPLYINTNWLCVWKSNPHPKPPTETFGFMGEYTHQRQIVTKHAYNICFSLSYYGFKNFINKACHLNRHECVMHVNVKCYNFTTCMVSRPCLWQDGCHVTQIVMPL